MTESRFARIDKRLTSKRILTLDIERLPGLARVWDQKTNFIPVSQWTRLPSLLCISAKWYDSREVMFRSAWDDPEAMVRDTWSWIDQADILYTFNGDRFDIPHLRGSFLEYGLGPTRPFKSVDIYKLARSLFAFESRSLVHLCDRLGIPGKQGRYDAEQAEAALAGDEKAQRALRRYNCTDTRITERAADHLRGWLYSHPQVATTAGDELRCNQCGGRDLKALPTDYTAEVLTFAQYRCGGCGGIVVARHHKSRIGRTRGVR